MAGSRRLNTYVTVGGVTYGPGEVDAEVADQIENEAVFEQDEKPAAASRKSSTSK